MNKRINPFEPNSPIGPHSFAGRLQEIETLEHALRQTRAGKPKHFMLTGERGIGKTSLLNYIRLFAGGAFEIDGETHKYLVLDLDIDKATTTATFARKIERSLKHQLDSDDPISVVIEKAWRFISRLEIAGTGIREESWSRSQDGEDLIEELAYSLEKTESSLCRLSDGKSQSHKYHGLFICIDEADRASKDLELGSMLKTLLERLQRRGCSRTMIGLAGLPNLRDVLRESHESSLRIFNELELRRLEDHDVRQVITSCIQDANNQNLQQTAIDPKAESILVELSEGYPHFIQQFGYCAFAADTDGIIDSHDVLSGAFDPHGALELIGARYYRDSFYNKIKQESYRRVLRIMAERKDDWVSKEQIKAEFKGKESVLSNALQALRKRHIILAQEGTTGVYRLQHKGFALWIKLQTKQAATRQASISADGFVA